MRRNYEMEEGEFQSIYNLQEMFISLLTKDDCSSVLPLAGKLKEVDDMFGVYAVRNLEDRSVNGQNSRKSALLSQLLLRHKVMQLPQVKDANVAEIFGTLLKDFIAMFREAASLVFDLGPYLLHIKLADSEQTRLLASELVSKLSDYAEEVRESSP